MPITFFPGPGTVLICDFDSGFKPPEMVKCRPVVVISPRRRTSKLCTVVPLSTTRPDPIEPHHHRLDPKSLPGDLGKTETWAKCDMVITISISRLDRVKVGKDQSGKRLYTAGSVIPPDLEAIRRAVMAGLGIVPQA